jgi:hypothetical protein
VLLPSPLFLSLKLMGYDAFNASYAALMRVDRREQGKRKGSEEMCQYFLFRTLDFSIKAFISYTFPFSPVFPF